jgi:molecular chaperone HtpG
MFWKTYGSHIKEGVAIEQNEPEKLFPLLRFHTDQDLDGWTSLDQYVKRAGEDQEEIYYFLGEDPSAVRFSPHMEAFRKAGIEVLVMAEPVDPFMLLQLKEYQNHPLVNVADADLPESQNMEDHEEASPSLDPSAMSDLVRRFKTSLGEKVSDVRATDRLVDSPTRLVDPEGSPDQSVQRVYKMMDKSFKLPTKVLELNPRHPILKGLSDLQEGNPKFDLIANQLYENALLIEGLHPDPVSMISRIQELIAEALGEGKSA